MSLKAVHFLNRPFSRTILPYLEQFTLNQDHPFLRLIAPVSKNEAFHVQFKNDIFVVVMFFARTEMKNVRIKLIRFDLMFDVLYSTIIKSLSANLTQPWSHLES